MEPSVGMDADVIIVGGGLGGSAAALQLAERGLTVLVLEAGPGEDVVTPPRPTRTEKLRRVLSPSRGRQTTPDLTRYSYFLADPYGTGTLRPAPTRMGQGVGGSSQFYASALSRFKRSDFAEAKPGRSAEHPLPNEWPVDFDAFSEYYDRAELLMRVRGEPDPLDPGDSLRPGKPLPPLAPGSVRLHEELERRGLHPYRLHVGIDYVAACSECFAARCPRACKADGNNRLLVRALATGRVRLEVGTTVEEIATEGGTARVVVRNSNGARSERRAARLVLAAGALWSPLILDRSADLWRDVTRPPMLGRGLMFHLTDSWAVNLPDGDTLPKKWLGLRDFYDDGVHNMGEIQSVGAYLTPGPIVQIIRSRISGTPLRRVPVLLLKPLAWAAARLLGRRPIFATITEDLPHERNRIWEEDGKIVVDYAVDPVLREHTAAFRSTVRKAFGPAGVLFTARPSEPNWGHPMGTCRMGTDPLSSVTTPEGQVHGHPEIFVADASTFPSSGGTGPALTVVAQALRVADQLADHYQSGPLLVIPESND